ncbi:hypothetical protein Asp14428_21500 [Actinoplanes sp. NBRC 14428]|uniref:NitT/TauT family transport system substrate-binding protein n=1 Tax=Pseudosporangium ferrugineum TaxID=439699 RepID=A0A2T0RLK2_9ACTN|nr:ABC transporter substrate-binding protein [Pseudosporangium ferrugineum]PRY22048.1 NitT/TauT family transport system substrate-binding protein [Pseudosporangium ferrugineum]BCJ50675.1 hypothetical protein Asp14428_21500 [Actinoplanes sp. NBRC 14428]
MTKLFRVFSAVLAAAALTVASGCSGDDDAASGSPSSGGKTTKVTYVTAFGAVGRDSFVWLAKEKGFFKEAGIDIDIQKGAGNVQNLTMIKSGQAQFSALDFTGAVIQAGTGAFKDWRAVAAIHQQTLVSIMTTKDTGIASPTDLKGKTVAAGAQSVSQLLFPAYAKLAGLDPKTVTIKGVQTTALTGLMANKQVDALSTFLLSKKGLEIASKKEVVVMPYSKYLSDLYGNAIIAKPSLISSDPDLVKRFVGAAMKGLQYTIDHPDEAAAVMNKAEPSAAVPAAIGEITAMKPYCTAPAGGALGSMDESRVARSIAVLSGAGLMPAGLTPADVVDFSFTPKA